METQALLALHLPGFSHGSSVKAITLSTATPSSKMSKKALMDVHTSAKDFLGILRGLLYKDGRHDGRRQQFSLLLFTYYYCSAM
jgi:hypothetical protein